MLLWSVKSAVPSRGRALYEPFVNFGFDPTNAPRREGDGPWELTGFAFSAKMIALIGDPLLLTKILVNKNFHEAAHLSGDGCSSLTSPPGLRAVH